jgi:hypothetical protein
MLRYQVPERDEQLPLQRLALLVTPAVFDVLQQLLSSPPLPGLALVRLPNLGLLILFSTLADDEAGDVGSACCPRMLSLVQVM